MAFMRLQRTTTRIVGLDMGIYVFIRRVILDLSASYMYWVNATESKEWNLIRTELAPQLRSLPAIELRTQCKYWASVESDPSKCHIEQESGRPGR